MTTASTNNTFQYSLCEWGWQQPVIWGHRIAQSWRNNGDIKPYWSALAAILNEASFLCHFTAWALLKSPLFIGTDLTKASKQSLDILGNRDLIKINQDPDVGESISPFRWGVNADYTFNATHPAEYWSGNTSYGIVFMILNSQDTTQEMSFNLTESWAIRAGRQYSVYDLWSHEDVGIAVRNISMELPAHGVSALLLNDAGPEPQEYDASCGFFYQCSCPNGTYISN
ncbi:hypothetical protein KC347_g8644 [Hortaea werneckii]|nr:hypothetical protein KC347_g8644 [Hortaea werneckii]